MRYCKKCVQPDTRPGIYFNEEGICGACLWKEDLENISCSITVSFFLVFSANYNHRKRS